MEMNLGKTGGAKAQQVLKDMAARSAPAKNASQMFTIRPPPSPSPDDDEDEEGVSTIKVTALPMPFPSRPPPSPIDEDFEDGFALPSDLTTLSLRPLSLAHRTSKSSLEWGDKDQTSSSQSSDAYSTFGFADNSPSSNYTSASLPETETEEDEEEEDILEGLDVPSGLFETGHGAQKLGRILEVKKRTAFGDDRVKVVSPDPEDDFEIGLVIDNDVELSPSRLLQSAQTVMRSTASSRSKSAPPRPPAALRPPSRVKGDRAKSPSNPPISSMSQLRRITAPPASPPSRTAQPIRSQTYSQAVASPSSMTFLAAKPGSLRVQKSTSGLKPVSPPQTRRLGRKASLPSLTESNQAQASGSGSGPVEGSHASMARYETPTASSKAKKAHTATTSRLYGLEYNVPPTRPSTPSSNPAALRLTMPTSSSRMKARAPISNVFPTSAPPLTAPVTRSTSPLPPARPPSRPTSRPPSAASSAASIKSRHTSSASLPNASKVLKKPKRQRTYGDGTELDGFDDLPTDREKEGQYRVQPKGYGNRIPGASYPKSSDASVTGTIRRKGKRDFSGSGSGESGVHLFHGDQWLMSALLQNRQGRQGPRRLSSAPAGLSFPQSLRLFHNSSVQRMRNSVRRRRRLPLHHIRGENRLSSAIWVALAQPKVGQYQFHLPVYKILIVVFPVVGEMKWNPTTLRWEGNDQALRDFDSAVGTSSRPALITHLTGSSIGSPVGSFASGARVVGNMIFDPQRMCWISTLPPDEEEPDVFADLADDEDDDDWEARGATIRASQQPQPGFTAASDKSSNSSVSRVEAPSPARSHTRSMSESESDRCSRASMVCDVDDTFVEKCRAAEERHRSELKNWLAVGHDVFSEPDRSYLYEIRALATRQY